MTVIQMDDDYSGRRRLDALNPISENVLYERVASPRNRLGATPASMNPSAGDHGMVAHQPDLAQADKSERPYISVAIPTFRRPEMLRRAIDSVLHQEFSDWELVVSDDEGPQGGSWATLAEYARSEPRIRVVENRRGRGQVENTNNAMLSCGGHWIKLLHDDDWLARGALQVFAEVAKAHPTAAFLTSASNMVRENRIKYRRGRRVTVYSSEACLMDLYLVGTTRSLGIIPSTLLINSRAIHAGCLMRTYKSIVWGVDQLFFVDLARQGDLVAIEDGLVFYDGTDHPNITASHSFSAIDRETLDLKRFNWSLIKDKKGVPDPETVVRALRVARLRSRFRHQSLRVSICDAIQLMRPSVLWAVNAAIRVRTVRVDSAAYSDAFIGRVAEVQAADRTIKRRSF